MPVVSYSTADLPQRGGTQDWATIIHQYMDGIEVESFEREGFQGSFSSTMLGENQLCQVKANEQSISRDPRKSDRKDPTYHLIYVREGSFELKSATYRGVVHPSEWIVLSNQEAFQFDTSVGCSAMVLHMADRWLRNFLPDPIQIVERQRLDNNAWHESLRFCLRAISETPVEKFSVGGIQSLEQVPRLLSLACGIEASDFSRHQSVMMRAVMTEIRAHHSTAGLTAETVANQLGISRRHLYAILEKHGTSFLRELQETRLTRAAEMLASPRFASTAIADIAASVGFLDPAHFSRLFKSRYDVTPRQYRQNTVHH